MPFITMRSINPGTINAEGTPSSVGHAWVEISDSASSPSGGKQKVMAIILKHIVL